MKFLSDDISPYFSTRGKLVNLLNIGFCFCFSFLDFIFKWFLYPTWAWTYNPEIRSHTLYWLSRPGTPWPFFFFFFLMKFYQLLITYSFLWLLERSGSHFFINSNGSQTLLHIGNQKSFKNTDAWVPPSQILT